MTKSTKWHVRPAKTQISLGICPVWSESSLCAQRVAKDPRFLHVDSEDSDLCPVWSEFAGRTGHTVCFVMRQLKLKSTSIHYFHFLFGSNKVGLQVLMTLVTLEPLNIVSFTAPNPLTLMGDSIPDLNFYFCDFASNPCRQRVSQKCLLELCLQEGRGKQHEICSPCNVIKCPLLDLMMEVVQLRAWFSTWN